MKTISYALLTLSISAIPAWATVTVSSPFNGETVSTSANYVATATTATCSKGVASMGVYVDGELIKVENGSNLNATISLTVGSHKTVVQEWDYCGGSTYVPIAVTVATQSGVFVTSPVPNSTVNLLTNYVATATSPCSKGVASMGIYVNNKLTYVVQGAKLNTQLNLSPGAQHTVVEEWDNCGGAAYSTVNVTVTGSGTKLSNLQTDAGWESWGQLPPFMPTVHPVLDLAGRWRVGSVRHPRAEMRPNSTPAELPLTESFCGLTLLSANSQHRNCLTTIIHSFLACTTLLMTPTST